MPSLCLGCISGQALGKTFVVDSGLGWVRNLALSWVQNSNIIRVGSLSPCSSLPGCPVAIDLLQPPVQSILLTCRPCMTGLMGGWGVGQMFRPRACTRGTCGLTRDKGDPV